VISVFNWLIEHWFLIFLLSALGVFGGIRDFAVETFNAVTGIRHKRRMRELRLQARIAAGQPAALPKPGLCVHRNVVPVVSAEEKVVAWLCRSCDTRLPEDWAVREEDL
jgi:hypothetical protein